MSELEPIKGSPTDAKGVVAALVDTGRATGIVVPPSWLAIVGRHAKTLLGGGMRVDIVIAACWMAILRGQPQMAQHIAGDLVLAGAGLKMTRAEYEMKLALYGAQEAGRLSLLDEERTRRQR